ncbi:MAG: hypothetical protein JWN34_5529 [Bryobacterales bacterium]|nr:hypothetical protein [Bryobacterales bacterium]
MVGDGGDLLQSVDVELDSVRVSSSERAGPGWTALRGEGPALSCTSACV